MAFWGIQKNVVRETGGLERCGAHKATQLQVTNLTRTCRCSAIASGTGTQLTRTHTWKPDGPRSCLATAHLMQLLVRGTSKSEMVLLQQCLE